MIFIKYQPRILQLTSPLSLLFNKSPIAITQSSVFEQSTTCERQLILNPHGHILANYYSSVILASFREESFERYFPFPIAKVVFTHTTLVDPTHIASTVTFFSFAIYDFSGNCIAHIKQLKAVVQAQHSQNPMSGFNTFYGPDVGPAPPGFQQIPQFPGHFSQPSMQPFPTTHTAFYQQPGFIPQQVLYQTQPGQVKLPGTFPPNPPMGGVTADGYNIIYPTEYCKIHIFKTVEKPWQITIYNWDNAGHTKYLIPCSTKIKEFMQNFGCTNSDAKKNIVYEVVEKGNGKWASGLRICGDDKDKMKKTLGDFGWNMKRTGNPGELPVVWLWITKDGQ